MGRQRPVHRHPRRERQEDVYYRRWLNRFNLFDGDIPGNDFQFPVSIEGVLGYNNAIQLTQPMHMQDLKYFRDPLYAYGDWVSSGESPSARRSRTTRATRRTGTTTSSSGSAPRRGRPTRSTAASRRSCATSPSTPSATSRASSRSSTTTTTTLVEYASGFYTGNDSDAVALAFYNTPGTGRNAIGRAQDRTETAFWYSHRAGRRAEIYDALGDSAKAAEMRALADTLKNAVLSLWDPAGPACSSSATSRPAT